MMIGGLRFPLKDELPGQREAHGPILLWLIRIHPLAMWIFGMVVGLIIGLIRKRYP
jgi:hypothetical protein